MRIRKGLNIPSLGRSGNIVVFSDVHIGADTFDEAHLKNVVAETIRSKFKVFLNGDIVENSIVNGSSPGEKLLEQNMVPTDQMKYAADLFAPIAKAGNLLGVVRGNHEARSRREALVDLSDILAHSLGVPYLGLGGYLMITHGSQKYTIALHHGGRGSVNTWRELDSMVSLYPNADLVGAGHDHNFCTREVTSIALNDQGEEEIRVVHQVRTGTYLRYAEYARGNCYLPTAVGSPILKFHSLKKHINVDCSTFKIY